MYLPTSFGGIYSRSGTGAAALLERKDVTNEAKVVVYNAFVLSILLFGCESWSLTERLRNQLRTFHRRCVRDMCRLSMWHVQQYRITARYAKTTGCSSVFVFNSLFSASACFFFVFSIFVDLDPLCCAWRKKTKKKVPAGDCGLNGSI